MTTNNEPLTTNQIAAKIIDSLNSQKDEGLRLLEILSLTKDADIEQVLKAYTEIKSKKISVAKIVSSIELDSKQKKNLEGNISKMFKGEIVFIYKIDSDVKGGLEIRVGDSLVDLNLDWQKI